AVAAAVPAPKEASVEHLPPVLPQDVTQFYVAPAAAPAGAAVEYRPFVLGWAEVTFLVNKRQGVEHVQTVALLAAPAAAGIPVAWEKAGPLRNPLAEAPLSGARWA